MAPTQAQSQSQKQDVSDWSSPFPVESVSTKSKWMLASHSSPCILGNPPACHDGISGRTPAPRRLATCQIENHRKKSRGGDKMRNCRTPSGKLLHCGRQRCERMWPNVEGCVPQMVRVFAFPPSFRHLHPYNTPIFCTCRRMQ